MPSPQDHLDRVDKQNSQLKKTSPQQWAQHLIAKTAVSRWEQVLGRGLARLVCSYAMLTSLPVQSLPCHCCLVGSYAFLTSLYSFFARRSDLLINLVSSPFKVWSFPSIDVSPDLYIGRRNLLFLTVNLPLPSTLTVYLS